MSPYLMTLIFLTLMSVLTSSEVIRFSQHNIGDRLYTHFQEGLVESENEKAQADLENFRMHIKEVSQTDVEKPKRSSRKSSNRRSRSLGFNLSRPPNNSRLNLYLIIHRYPIADYLYECTARLIRSLYSEAEFFKQIPNVEYRILNKLNDLKEKTVDFNYPDELSTLDFEEEELQKIFYLMLKGAEGCPSLLNYITFDDPQKLTRTTKKVNLMFAAPCVIEALFNNPDVSEQVITLRDHLWAEIIDQETNRLQRTKDEGKNRTIFKNEFKEGLEKILPSGIKPTEFFDLSLGKLGNILFLKDPETDFIRREKL